MNLRGIQEEAQARVARPQVSNFSPEQSREELAKFILGAELPLNFSQNIKNAFLNRTVLFLACFETLCKRNHCVALCNLIFPLNMVLRLYMLIHESLVHSF